MKPVKLVLLLGLLCGAAAQGQVSTHTWSEGFENGGVVPDGNVIGWSDSRVISGLTHDIQSINVTLSLSGGFNGDLYGYLRLDYDDLSSGGFAVLLNRPGRTSDNLFGYSDSGFSNVVFSDSASNGDVHFYQMVLNPAGGPLTGTWEPDGRNVSPLAVLGTEPRDAMLSAFNLSDPNGTWTLFLSDVSSGGGPVQVQEWGLVITVPEPGTVVLGLLGGALLFGRLRSRRC